MNKIYKKLRPHDMENNGTYHDFLYQYWNKEDQVLIIGCGAGTQSRLFINAINLDIDRDELMYCKKKGISNLIQASASHLPFKQSFNKILMADIIEHFPPSKNFTQDVIREISRVSACSGHVAVIMPLKDRLNPLKSILNRIMHKPAPIWSLEGHTNPLTKLDLIRIFHHHFMLDDDRTPQAIACGIKLHGCFGGQYAQMMFRKNLRIVINTSTYI